VSVIAPTYNEGGWIRRTVDTVLDHSQGWEIEVIVVDDGSTDGSCDFLRPGGPSYSAVRLIEGGGLGVAGARNRGAAAASGDVLVFLDAHVLPDTGWIEELTGILRDPTVGLAGLGVRDIENPSSVGYAYTFANEYLGAGWAEPSADEPFESPAVSGCCIGVRRDRFEEIGGFESSYVRWGIEEMELGLRTWYLGYRCVVSPRVQVGHYFKHDKPRNFDLSWEEYDANLLRCALTYFSGQRLETILNGVRQRGSFDHAWAEVAGDPLFWGRREALRGRFRRDEAWYFHRFKRELAPFEGRLRELQNWEEYIMVASQQKRRCARCGATNIGVQTDCLLCHGMLVPMPEAPQPDMTQLAPAQRYTDATQLAPVQGLPSASPPCTNCGAQVPAGAKFCVNCGTPATVAAPTPVAAAPSCRQCGAGLSPGQRFCVNCGTPVAGPG
jgi:GT2 family glycosyltransferase